MKDISIERLRQTGDMNPQMKMSVTRFAGDQIHATLAPQFSPLVLMKNGVVNTVNHAKKNPEDIARPNVRLRNRFDGISPAVTQLRFPMVEPYAAE